jgi:Fe(3+) dicitrate transport protein
MVLGCNAMYEISASMHIYGGLTQNYRPVLFSDHYTQTPNEKVVLPLRDAFGEQGDIGIKGTLKSIFSFDVNGYFIHYNNRTGLVYRADSIFKTTIGHSKTYGMSIYFDCNTNALFKNKNSEIQYTLFSAITLNNARYSNLNTGINNFSGHFLEYAPVWSGKSGITIAYKTLKLQWTLYAQHLSYSDPSNAKTANLSANIGPLPGYYIHDLGLTYIFKKTITWSMMASNLCNSRYYTRKANGYPGPGLIPGMPRYVSFALSYSI